MNPYSDKMLENKKLIVFVAKALGLLLLWIFGYELWLKGDGRVDEWLTSMAAEHSAAVFSFLGLGISHQLTSYGEAMVVDNQPLLYIAHSCNGLVLYAMFAGFILIFSGKWLTKVLYIAASLVGIYCLNILRILFLCLIQLNHPEYLDISHKYIFTIIVYGAIFLLWMKWVQMQPVPKKDKKAKKVHG